MVMKMFSTFVLLLQYVLTKHQPANDIRRFTVNRSCKSCILSKIRIQSAYQCRFLFSISHHKTTIIIHKNVMVINQLGRRWPSRQSGERGIGQAFKRRFEPATCHLETLCHSSSGLKSPTCRLDSLALGGASLPYINNELRVVTWALRGYHVGTTINKSACASNGRSRP